MKKFFSSKKYKRIQKTYIKSLSIKRHKQLKRSHRYAIIKLQGRISSRKLTLGQKNNGYEKIVRPLEPPKDFRVLNNMERCLDFFHDLRLSSNCSIKKNIKIIRVDLSKVEKIDYVAINILISISRDLKNRNIILNGNFPNNEYCKALILKSGFLNYMYNSENKPFPNKSESDSLFITKGQGKLSLSDSIKITEIIKKTMCYLTGEKKNNSLLKSLLLEMCGNSIEHAMSHGKQWLLGVIYDENEVCYFVTDVGQGILGTIYKKFRDILFDIFRKKSNLEVLVGAFNEKYGSRTKDTNRNRGLPFIKKSAENRILLDLSVITNNVYLHFENENLSKCLDCKEFLGTMYIWKITKESIINAEKFEYEY